MTQSNFATRTETQLKEKNNGNLHHACELH
jgi:hypothetical protein